MSVCFFYRSAMHAGRATRFRSRSVSTSTTSPYPRCSPRGQPHQPSQQQSPGVASAASVHCDDGRSGGCVDAADADASASSSSAAASASSSSSSNFAALSGGGGGQQVPSAVGFCPAVGGMAETASPLLPVGELAAEGVGEGDRGDGTTATANAGADDAGADATPDGSVALPRQSVHANVAAGAGAGSERAAREHAGLRPPAAAGAAHLSVCEPAVKVRAGDDDQLCRIVSDVVRRRQQQQRQKQQQQVQKQQPAQLQQQQQQPSQQVTSPLIQSPPAAQSKVPSSPPPGDEPDFGADNAAVVAQSVLSLFREMHRPRRPCPQQRSRRQTGGGGGGGGGLRRVGGAMTVGRRLGRTLRAVALGYGIRSLLVGAGALTALGGYALGGPHLLAATLYAVSHFADPTAVAAIV